MVGVATKFRRKQKLRQRLSRSPSLSLTRALLSVTVLVNACTRVIFCFRVECEKVGGEGGQRGSTHTRSARSTSRMTQQPQQPEDCNGILWPLHARALPSGGMMAIMACNSRKSVSGHLHASSRAVLPSRAPARERGPAAPRRGRAGDRGRRLRLPRPAGSPPPVTG